jgi:hypothetical protein
MIIKTTLTDPEAAGVWLAGTVGVRNDLVDSTSSEFLIHLQGGDFTKRLVCSFSVYSLHSAETVGYTPNVSHNFTYDAELNTTIIKGMVNTLGSVTGQWNYDNPTPIEFGDPYTAIPDNTQPIDKLAFGINYLIFVSKNSNSLIQQYSGSAGKHKVTENLKGILK